MPGMFGAVGPVSGLQECLRDKFMAPWGCCESVSVPGGIIGGHAFGQKRAVFRLEGNTVFAVDGELSVYTAAHKHTVGKDTIFNATDDQIRLTQECKGNVALADCKSRRWYLASELSGTFPLYYAQTNRGLLFCSRMRPLASVIQAPMDPVGVVEFLTKGYTLAGRTLFDGIRRLLPGQVLSYSPDQDQLRIAETSRLWTNGHADGDLSTWVSRVWQALNRSVDNLSRHHGKHALMLSAGWDSRLLLSVLLRQLRGDGMIAYTHGDPQSLELRIVRAISQFVGVQLHEESLDTPMVELDSLQRAFGRSETILFPEWHWAGSILESMGVKCVLAGVYGEVLGGHYGPPMIMNGSKKALASILLLMPNCPKLRVVSGFSGASETLLQQGRVNKPHYVSRAFWSAIDNITDQLNHDLKIDLARLQARGIEDGDTLVEAFVTEHRGTQYINAQMLSTRSMLDISMPYVDTELLEVATQCPLRLKFGNAINRAVLQAHGRALLQFASAATVLPVAYPIPVQEVARAGRRVVDKARWWLYLTTNGRVPPQRTGWPNFEFLRSSDWLSRIVNDLKCDIWDREMLSRMLVDAAEFNSQSRMSTIRQTLLRVYSVDLMLRA